MIGKKILHYQISEKLGEGGMGEVYLARDTKLDRDVALKFLPASVREDEEARERLIREARAASRLNHGNIVAIYAIEAVDGQDFIVMEYVRGQTLRAAVKSGTLTVDRALDLTNQIGKALAAAHDAGIVHRDIKSENILVTDSGEAKILDFGLAKLHGTTRLTGDASTLGTMAYMSPEQTQGEDVDSRSDLFSLGVVIYEMVTGHMPFSGEHIAAVTYAIVNETPEPLARYKSDVSDDLQRLIDKALRKDRNQRYQTARDLLADLSVLRPESGTQTGIRVQRKKSRPVVGLAIGVVVVVVAVAALWTMNRRVESIAPLPGNERLMLAVLPFQNLGAATDDYFADGITEEITTHLAKLSGLGVISRTSALAYKDTDKTLREIGGELGVDYVLEGTIRWDKSGGTDRVRINPQLIRVSDDTHLWANTYDRILKEIFSTQTDIATEVASALNVTLLEPEKQALERRPTDNLDAYGLYLRGKDIYEDAVSLDDLGEAIEKFEQAVALDSTFATAHAWIARLESNAYFNNIRMDEDPLGRAKVAAQAAVRHADGGTEGDLAMGYYHYYGSRNYDEAMKSFRKALAGQPNDSALLEAMGYVQRRQGLWDESIESLRKACELDPRSPNKFNGLVQTLANTRDFAACRRLIAERLEADPDEWGLYLFQGMIELISNGDTDAAKRGVEMAAKYAPASALAETSEQLDILDGNYDAALARRADLSEWGVPDTANFYLSRAAIYYLKGDQAKTQEMSTAAIKALDANLARRPDAFQLVAARAQAYSYLGQTELAIAESKRAIEIMPMEKDALTAVGLMAGLSEAYVMAGEFDKALDILEYLLTIPGYPTPAVYRINPLLKPLYGEPRFRRLAELELVN